MSSSSIKSLPQSLISVQNTVLAGVAWAFLALLFFLFFSVPPEVGAPEWYGIGTLIFELVAYLAAAILCFRNWRSPQIASGRNVWLGIGLGMLSYFIGSAIFGYWENGLGLDPAVTPGDLFYVASYLFLGWGMISAVFSRKLTLEGWQWAIVAGIGIVGSLLAWVIAAPPDAPAQSWLTAPANAQTAPAKPTVSPSARRAPAPIKTARPPAKPATKPVAARTLPKPAATRTAPAVPATPVTASPAVEPAPVVPAWVTDIEAQLAPLETGLNRFYIISDVGLLILATVLLLAFWGGRFSVSWRMIAAAAFCLYIADMWFQYASRLPNYQSGSLPEVFWVFSGVLFGLGAALEYGLSTNRSRRTPGRRRG